MLAVTMSVGILASFISALVLGVPTLACLVPLSCLLLMRHFFRQSGDVLDPRAGFCLAVLLFLAIPNLVLSTEFGANGTLWISRYVTHLTVQRRYFDQAQLIFAVGFTAVVLPMLFSSIPDSTARGERHAGVAVWAIFWVTSALIGAMIFVQYGGPLSILLAIVDPVSRMDQATEGSFGLMGILIFIVASSAYFLCRSGMSPIGRGWLFLLPAMFVLPLGNRGTLVVMLAIAGAGVSGLRVASPFRFVAGACMLLPPFAGSLVTLRNIAVGSSPPWSLGLSYRNFADDSPMMAVFAYALHALEDGRLDFTYGLDLLMYPLWYVPRVVWPSKPMPLDFRLNEQLALNDGVAFGTPLGLFGGVFLNFSWLAYVPVLLGFGWLICRVWPFVSRDRLLLLLFYVFVIDLVRVGDLSRELVTCSITLLAYFIVRSVTTPERGTRSITSAATPHAVRHVNPIPGAP